MKILAKPSATRRQVNAYVAARAPASDWRRWGVRRMWEEAVAEGVDPVGVIMQSAKETGWGRYPGDVPLRFCNTCGLRVDQTTLALIERAKRSAPSGVDAVLQTLSHEAFPNWIIGARAHVQHLLAYVGRKPTQALVDRRYGLVGAPKITDWTGLSRRWAVPGEGYGEAIEKMIRGVKAVR